jgi:hypothetical protein
VHSTAHHNIRKHKIVVERFLQDLLLLGQRHRLEESTCISEDLLSEYKTIL